MLKKIFNVIALLAFLSACKKDTNSPESEKNIEAPSKFSYQTLNKTIDSVSYNHPLELDLNDDKQVDYFLTSVLLMENDRPYLYLLINRKSPAINKVLVKDGEPFTVGGLWGVPLNANTKIEEAVAEGTKWNDSLTKAFLLNVSDNGTVKTFSGEWIGKKDKYLGLKFLINGKYHFGWLRISHTAGEEKLSIIDYAYNNTPGETILAGEK